MGTRARLMLCTGLLGVAVIAPAAPSFAQGVETTVVNPAADAWYRTSPSCTLPIGCVDGGAAPSPYTPGTLHVGINAGQEEARTYLQLDLSRLPAGTKPSGGTLLLPLAAGVMDGTRAPEAAQMRACVVKGAVVEADGEFTAPPEADCGAVSEAAIYVPAEGPNPAGFTVDLTAHVQAWAEGATPGALALVPAASSAPPTSWHLAFSDRERTGEGVVPISAALAVVSTTIDTGSAQPPSVPAPAFEVAEPPALEPGAGSVEVGTSFAAPPLAAAAPQQAPPALATGAAPVVAPVEQVVPVASIVQSGFRYPAVFLLPLLLAVGAGWLGRALTRDLVQH